MFFLYFAILFFIVSTFAAWRASSPGRKSTYPFAAVSKANSIAMYFMLIGWVQVEGGARIYQGDEAGLLGWFVAGLIFSAARFDVWEKRKFFTTVAAIGAPVAALCYAMGFDVLQPDAYSYVPAAILGALILIVAAQAFIKLSRRPTSKGPKSKGRDVGRWTLDVPLAANILCVAILVYSATFKVIDRGWLLPWSYMAAAGGILFAVSQLWLGLGASAGGRRVGVAPLRGKTQLHRQKHGVPLWAQVAAGRFGELLMVVSAFFVYREFL